MPLAIEQALAFVDRNTRHPMRVVGSNRVRLDEYPVEALREALVNAIAHRDYDDGSRKIMLEVFSDRVVVSSPGLPPLPLTVQKLAPANTNPARAIRFSPSVFHFSNASKNVVADSVACTTKCSTTASISPG